MDGQPEYQERIAVSVIIPVYNAAKYLPQCLDSICHQTLRNIEIICIDDGSTDDSLEILKAYAKKDSRFQLLQQKNIGAGAARNAGLSLACGEYLSFLDADDFFELDFLEKLYQQGICKNAEIVICDANAYCQDTGKTQRLFTVSSKETRSLNTDVLSYRDIPDHIFNIFQNCAWNKLFRRAFIQTYELKFQEIMRTNDLLFTCTALVHAEQITTVPEALIYYRMEHGGNCQASNEKAPLDFYKALVALKEHLYDYDLYGAVAKSFLNLAFKCCIYNVLSINSLPIKKDICQFLSHEGLENLGIKHMGMKECHRNFDRFELLCLKSHLWTVLKLEQKLKVLLKHFYKK